MSGEGRAPGCTGREARRGLSAAGPTPQEQISGYTPNWGKGGGEEERGEEERRRRYILKGKGGDGGKGQEQMNSRHSRVSPLLHPALMCGGHRVGGRGVVRLV